MIYLIFIIPLLIIIIGFLMYKYPPKKPNLIVGYRSRKSMKNENVWKKANKYCGELLIKAGLITLLISCLILSLIYFEVMIFSETLLTVVVIVEVCSIILSGIMVENKIKNYK